MTPLPPTAIAAASSSTAAIGAFGVEGGGGGVLSVKIRVDARVGF